MDGSKSYDIKLHKDQPSWGKRVLLIGGIIFFGFYVGKSRRVGDGTISKSLIAGISGWAGLLLGSYVL